MNATEYVLLLAVGVRYRVRFEADKGKVFEFVVQLERLKNDIWKPVVRYDTAHGFAHRDRYDAAGQTAQHEPLPAADFNDALTYAIKDIRTNWEAWIAEYEVRP
jgi:hypothetical protein